MPNIKDSATIPTATYVHNDGGREAAGFTGDANDCVTRAVAIAAELDYRFVYDRINELAKSERPRKGRKRSSARTGVQKPTTYRLMAELGWTWTATMGIGTGCQVHLRREELPGGRLVVQTSKHVVAVIDGAIHDNHDPSRDGTRCVYGYWSAA